jgi:hypothetical protein
MLALYGAQPSEWLAAYVTLDTNNSTGSAEQLALPRTVQGYVPVPFLEATIHPQEIAASTK